jgi:hypothetical protein
MRSKVKKLVEKLDKDVTKLPRAEKEAEMAKQAYEQLNEQLFTELPQLIDLRVPYLDPSFKALVKIQLRFCAEAYSRIAQVQQYLDADTREQYARGDSSAPYIWPTLSLCLCLTGRSGPLQAYCYEAGSTARCLHILALLRRAA